MPYVQDADFTAEMHKLILNQLTNIRDNVDSVLLNVYVYLSCSVYIVLCGDSGSVLGNYEGE